MTDAEHLLFDPPFRTGENDQPDMGRQGERQYLYDVFQQMMRGRVGETHPRGIEGVRLPAVLSPVNAVSQMYLVTTIDRDTERQVEEPLVETIQLARNPLEVLMRAQIDQAALDHLGVPLL